MTITHQDRPIPHLYTEEDLKKEEMKIKVSETGIGREMYLADEMHCTEEIKVWRQDYTKPELPALDTEGNKLPIGEYKVDLQNQEFNSFTNKWQRHPGGANYFWGQRKVYIASVAPEKEVSIKRFNNQSGDTICQICDSDNPAWYAENELFNHVNGEAREGGVYCPVCFMKMAKDKGIEVIFKCITTEQDNINLGNQPEKEVDKSAIHYGYGLIDGIAGERKRLFASHVPIEEVEKLKNTITDLRNQIHELEVQNDNLQNN